MTDKLTIYTVIHQPERLKLPAHPIPKNTNIHQIRKFLFDDEMNKYYLNKVARECYLPAMNMFIDLMDRGFKMSVGISVSFLEQTRKWNKKLFNILKKFISHPNLELIGVEPYHSFTFYLDIDIFQERMKWMKEYLENYFNKSISVTDTTEMFMSNEVYFALEKLGFKGAVMDGRPWVLGWKQPTYLYRQNNGKMNLLLRNWGLSDDVGYRFSNKNWRGYPLKADSYADWIKNAAGDFAMLGWDFETFGEHHKWDTGIFEFMKQLPEELAKRNIEIMTPSSVIKENSDNVHTLELKEFGCTWAGAGGMEFFLGNDAQQAIFRLMHHVLNKAKLTKKKKLIDLALRLTQSDNLHLIQWAGRHGDEAEVSAYFTPKEWWSLGPDRLLLEQQRVYINFLNAMDHYL